MEIMSQTTSITNNLDLVAAAYLRVSLARQSKEGYSIEAQLNRIEEYVEESGFYLHKDFIFKDEKPATRIEGESTRDEYSLIESFSDRPDLTRLLIAAQRKEFKHLIVYSRDRLSRVVEDTIALELFFKRFGIKIHYVRQGEDFDESNSEIERLLHILFASLAEMEASLLSVRVKDGMKARVAKAQWPGGKPLFGYIPVIHTNNSTNKRKWHTTLEKSDLESELVKEIFRLYEKGLGYRRIAEMMNQKYNFIFWSKSKIETIIKNKTYCGQIAWDRRGGRRNSNRRNNQPVLSPKVPEYVIIDDDMWDRVEEERQFRAKGSDAHYYQSRFILKDKLVCSECKRIMKPKNRGRNKTNVYKCAGTKTKDEKCNVIIPCDLVENKFLEYMRESFFDIEDEGIDKFWKLYNDEYNNKVSKFSIMSKEIEQKIARHEAFILQLKDVQSKESDKHIQRAIHTQYTITKELIDKYTRALSIVENKAKITKRNKEELQQIIQVFLPALFVNDKDEDLIRMRREFVIHFIDSIEVSYDKESKNININKIEFLY